MSEEVKVEIFSLRHKILMVCLCGKTLIAEDFPEKSWGPAKVAKCTNCKRRYEIYEEEEGVEQENYANRVKKRNY